MTNELMTEETLALMIQDYKDNNPIADKAEFKAGPFLILDPREQLLFVVGLDLPAHHRYSYPDGIIPELPNPQKKSGLWSRIKNFIAGDNKE